MPTPSTLPPRPSGSAKIYVAGHGGMVGSAIVRQLTARDATLVTRSSAELDLRDQTAVEAFFAQERPTEVYLAAAHVGGIHANNTRRAEFLYDNLMIASNVIHAAHRHGVEKLLFLGSSCIYPRLAEQPLGPSSLLTGALEPTNEGYALAKLAGIKLCQTYRHQYGSRFISVLPANLYGPGDNYHPEDSHVLPGLLRRFHEAKAAGAASVTVWGSGRPLREFLHVDDLARACVHLMDQYEGADPVNIGSGEEVSIRGLAELIADSVGFQGTLAWDAAKPDGTPRKLLDSSVIRSMGWSPEVSLKDGVGHVYAQADWT